MPRLVAEPVIVEDAFAAPQIAALRGVLDGCRALMASEARASAKAGKPVTRPNSISFEALFKLDAGSLAKAAASTFLNSRAHDFAVEQFPDGYCFLLRYCSARYHDPASAKSHLALHFDANFLGLGGKAINVWVPLDDLGDGVPGLTFLSPDADATQLYRAWKGQHDARVAKAGATAAVDAFFSFDDVRALYAHLGADVFRSPHIRAGGFIAFHQLVPHATEIVSVTPKPRASLEFRIAGVSTLPERFRAGDFWVAVPKRDQQDVWQVEPILTRNLVT